MTMQEGLTALGEEAASRQRQDRAYFLDLLGDSQGGLSRYEAAIDAYRQAAQGFEGQGGAARMPCACSRSPTVTCRCTSHGTPSGTWKRACRCSESWA